MNKKITSGSSNFLSLIENNEYYVDKTRFIGELENLNYKFVFFLRPRRFGKSLFLSLLEYYYDVKHYDKFDLLFREYYIGSNPTVLKNSYFILKFNFSGISTDENHGVKESFDNSVRASLRDFLYGYSIASENEIEENLKTRGSADILRNCLSLFRKYKSGSKIYVLIDEYDHFTNELFSFDRRHFRDIVSQNGWIRKFYEVIKIGIGEGLIDRFFATGVTPVTLDGLTSGFNIATNLTTDEYFHEICGFDETEISDFIKSTFTDSSEIDFNILFKDLRSWYNGSKFSPDASKKLYNPQLIISFLNKYSRNLKYPREMNDYNVTSDRKKISLLIDSLPSETADSVLDEIFTKEVIEGGLTMQFSPDAAYTRQDAVSLLFYNGLLTIEDFTAGVFRFSIPNYVIKNIYWDFFRNRYESENNLSLSSGETAEIFREMAFDGYIRKLVQKVEDVMKNLSNNDFRNFSESNLKMILISILSANPVYQIKSELEISTGRVDLLLKRNKAYEAVFQYLFVFKFIKVKDEVRFEKIKEEGILQLKRYLESDDIRSMDNLRSFLIIFHNKIEGEIIEVR